MKYLSVADDVKLGENVKLANFVNLYGCAIDDNTKIGTFVEIQKMTNILGPLSLVAACRPRLTGRWSRRS
jgi:acyl-[acyl carrier protein]--UDP-N-acetylglucosamine O-acyltransferase